jgi:hypothetical protein
MDFINPVVVVVAFVCVRDVNVARGIRGFREFGEERIYG